MGTVELGLLALWSLDGLRLLAVGLLGHVDLEIHDLAVGGRLEGGVFEVGDAVVGGGGGLEGVEGAQEGGGRELVDNRFGGSAHLILKFIRQLIPFPSLPPAPFPPCFPLNWAGLRLLA